MNTRCLSLLPALATFFSAALAVAQPDFRPASVSDASVSNGELRFSVLVENAGSTAYRGPLKVRPLLLPPQARRPGFVNDRGVMVTARAVTVDLPPQSSTVVAFRGELPRVPDREYLLGVIVNSDRAVDEGSEAALANNLYPGLLPLGRVSSSGHDPLAAGADYYSDTFDNEFVRGGASHLWRLFKRGNPGAEGLRSLFLIADFGQHKIYDSSYEKGVHWADSGFDYDARGREVHYDIYSQAPEYESVPAGNLALLTLIDHTDATGEPVQSNNLDIRRFRAGHLTLAEPEAWCATVAGGSASTSIATLSTQYEAAANWSFSSPVPAWLTPSSTSGTLSGGQTENTLTLTCNPQGLAPGEYHEHIDIASAEYPAETQSLHLHFFVAPTADAAISVPAEVNVVGIRGQEAPVTTFSLRNPGTTPLRYRLSSANPWITFQSNRTGTIAAGGNVVVPLAVESQTLEADATGVIRVQTNRPGPEAEIPVRYVGNPPARD